MRPADSAAATVPDWLLLDYAPGALDTYACCLAGEQLALLWQTHAPLEHPDALAESLRQLLDQHAIAPDTPVGLCVPPDIGGLLLTPLARPRDAHDPAWCASVLQRHLPYPAADLLSRVRPAQARGQAEIFWVPRDWSKAQAAQLAASGLKLSALYPRAALWRPRATAGATPTDWQAHSATGPDNSDLHGYQDGLIQRSVRLTGTPAERRARQTLELAALGHAAEPLPAPAVSAQQLDALWQDPDEALDLALALSGNARTLWRPWLQLAGLLALVLLLIGSGLAWRSADNEAAWQATQGRYKTLSAARSQAQAAASETQRLQARLDALAHIDAAPDPLPTLNAVAAALPDHAWLYQASFDGTRLSIQGVGDSNAALIAQFTPLGLNAQAADSQAADSQAFHLHIELLPAGGRP
jgi:hypothetical protein